MGGILGNQEELDVFQSSLPSSFNSIRDWFSNLPEDKKTYQALKRKCVETYEFTSRGGCDTTFHATKRYNIPINTNNLVNKNENNT